LLAFIDLELRSRWCSPMAGEQLLPLVGWSRARSTRTLTTILVFVVAYASICARGCAVCCPSSSLRAARRPNVCKSY